MTFGRNGDEREGINELSWEQYRVRFILAYDCHSKDPPDLTSPLNPSLFPPFIRYSLNPHFQEILHLSVQLEILNHRQEDINTCERKI